MTADCHIHMVLDGINFKTALAAHHTAPVDALIHRRLRRYQELGVTYLRDGGDNLGVCNRAAQLAPAYGITYRMPCFPIHKAGHYGSFIGESYETFDQYLQLLGQVVTQGGHFVKLMLSGLMDFNTCGVLTEPALDAGEIKDLITAAHDLGLPVMAHVNGTDAVSAAVAAGVDSVEHGNYLHDDCLHALAESRTIWVPTLSPVGNLRGAGRFDDVALEEIFALQCQAVQTAANLGATIAPGSDAGAYCVCHGEGTVTEWNHLRRALGPQADAILQAGSQAIKDIF